MNRDLSQALAHGISEENFNSQLEHFRTGFPYLDVIAPATPEKGITMLSEEEAAAAEQMASQTELRITKFVPASGAASRMFKDLFKGLDVCREGGVPAEDSPAGRFCSEIGHFAFYTPELFENRTPEEILANTLTESGLEYGAKPKGQILFHSYEEGPRTAFEEHLVEAALYAKGPDGVCNIVCSVSEEHLDGFKALLASVKEKYEKRYGVKYNVGFTLQSPSTDTVAVNPDNTPFLKNDGSLLFRPGGHGALIGNVSDIDADIVIIKNIDNVIHQTAIEETVRWKKILTGRLVALRDKAFGYIRRIDEGNVSTEELWEMVGFLDREFCVTLPQEAFDGPCEKTLAVIRAKLDRPIRVCGMVRNLGEPGGGPYIVRDADGATSLQILESAQLKETSGTHFNPVDLACSLTAFDGRKFELRDYVDHNAGFISEKSYEGRDLKAQELPGLWNGAMSDWNTQFVDVPLITFNPVKTVLDLLRKEHQPM